MAKLQSNNSSENRQKLNLGKAGEDLAKNFLLAKGYNFLTSNFSCKSGEIDLIFIYRVSIIFVEVKTRSNPNFGNPEEAVNKGKLKHLRKSAEIFLLQNSQYQNFQPRIDVVAIDLASKEVRHYEAVY